MQLTLWSGDIPLLLPYCFLTLSFLCLSQKIWIQFPRENSLAISFPVKTLSSIVCVPVIRFTRLRLSTVCKFYLTLLLLFYIHLLCRTTCSPNPPWCTEFQSNMGKRYLALILLALVLTYSLWLEQCRKICRVTCLPWVGGDCFTAFFFRLNVKNMELRNFFHVFIIWLRTSILSSFFGYYNKKK